MKTRPKELQSSKRLAKHGREPRRREIISQLSLRLGLRDDASLRNFDGGAGCHVASALEKALLLPTDMAELRSIRKN